MKFPISICALSLLLTACQHASPGRRPQDSTATRQVAKSDTHRDIDQPVYSRGGAGWSYQCWIYEGSRAFHGRLWSSAGEVTGKENGETLETGLGTLVWRGQYSTNGVPEKSTGWLFVESFSGPPFIRDRYDPKTGR